MPSMGRVMLSVISKTLSLAIVNMRHDIIAAMDGWFWVEPLLGAIAAHAAKTSSAPKDGQQLMWHPCRSGILGHTRITLLSVQGRASSNEGMKVVSLTLSTGRLLCYDMKYYTSTPVQWIS